jgi:hypothetical protein
MNLALSRWQQRLLWGIAFSAAGMLAWNVIFWVVSPLPQEALRPLPDENAVIKVLTDTQLVTGAYRFPGLAEGQAPDGSYFDKHKRGPIGLLFYRREGVNPYTPLTIVLGLLHALLISAAAVGLLLLVLPALPTYGRRALFLGGVGVFAALALDFADPIRWHQPWGYHGYVALFDAVNGGVSALILAWFVDPAARENYPDDADPGEPAP